MTTAALSTAYFAPVQYYCKLYQYDRIYIEAEENYQKQTYRNRCHIAGANGVLPLSIPVEKPDTLKCMTRDIRISDHGNWRHLHWNAIISAYNTSPFFEYYADDFAPFYERKFPFLLDFNEQLQRLVCKLLDLHPLICQTEQYLEAPDNDFRMTIRPKHAGEDTAFLAKPYYQVFAEKHGFLPNLSILDLLFNMGPEGILVLKDSIRP